MSDETAAIAPLDRASRGVAGLGMFAGLGGLTSAAACCVLPLALGALGTSMGGLAAIVPFHWPLTIVAALAVAAGWLLYWRRRRACAADASCSVAPPARATLWMLGVATLLVALSAIWPLYLQAPLMSLFGGA